MTSTEHDKDRQKSLNLETSGSDPTQNGNDIAFIFRELKLSLITFQKTWLAPHGCTAHL